MAATPYFKNAILNWLKGVQMPTPPTSLYIGLLSNATTEITTSVRAAGRLALPTGAIANNGILNSAALDFGASVSSVTISHIGIYDAQTGGNLLHLIPLGSAISIPSGSSASAGIGTVGVTLP